MKENNGIPWGTHTDSLGGSSLEEHVVILPGFMSFLWLILVVVLLRASEERSTFIYFRVFNGHGSCEVYL